MVMIPAGHQHWCWLLSQVLLPAHKTVMSAHDVAAMLAYVPCGLHTVT